MWASRPRWKCRGRRSAKPWAHWSSSIPICKHLYTEQGKLRAFVNLYVNDEDIRYLEKEATALKEGDNISIVPSIAGGAF